ncbi:MAG TPA: hypothetical protein VFH47_08395 [Candidatus Thermoplasmatota archaeon]|nr:hypothetical protein [Candidatus Thermoplasmatota archaeon]
MARLGKCDVCGDLQETPAGCVTALLAGAGSRARRVPYGDEQHLVVMDHGHGGTSRPSTNCPSCGTPRGMAHHVPCRLEECPTCAGAAWSCRCILDRVAAA